MVLLINDIIKLSGGIIFFIMESKVQLVRNKVKHLMIFAVSCVGQTIEKWRFWYKFVFVI